jgi:hypothetical protein
MHPAPLLAHLHPRPAQMFPSQGEHLLSQSIKHTLRSLDKLAIDQQTWTRRLEKELADYRVQTDRPFEHEERLKQLLARQTVYD